MIIGIAGQRGAGKSAAAAFLVEKGFERQRFAQPLKDMLKAIGLTDAEVDGDLRESKCPLLCGRTPRHAMQQLGSLWGRDTIHPDLWVTLWRARAMKSSHVVVDDVRFPNEVEAIRSLGGAIWRINRPGYTGDSHVSEFYIREFRTDVDLLNNGGLAHLRAQVEAALIGTPGLAYHFGEMADLKRR